MLNTIIIQGRLTKNVELRHTTTGKAVASFTVAVDRGKNSGADFIPCVAWEKSAEFIEKYFHKGDMILVSGRLTQRNYEDKDGNKRTAYEVIVNTANFCDSKKSEDKQPVNAEPEFYDVDDSEDGLPF